MTAKLGVPITNFAESVQRPQAISVAAARKSYTTTTTAIANMTFRAERQLVYEWYTPSLQTSLEFLKAVGFKVLRQEKAFAEMAWGSSSSANRLFVEQMDGYIDTCPDVSPGYSGYHGNIRILVEDVDAVYQAAMVLKGARVLKPLEDRYYGLRDFTVGGPYGLALRFATPLPGFTED